MLDERFKKELFEDGLCSKFIDQGQEIPEDSVINYLKTYFPDSCFSRNYTQYSSLTYDDIYEELYKTFHYEILNWCRCGTPEEADKQVDKQVVKYLDLIDIPWKNESSPFNKKYSNSKKLCQEYFGCETIYDNPLLLCLAYTMDAAGFSEHGTGIGGAWITGRGKIYRYAIRKHLEKQEIEEE